MSIHIPFSFGPVVVEVLVKSLLLLLIAAAVLRLMRSATASARHLVWTLAMLCLLLLPLGNALAPSWRAFTLDGPASAPALHKIPTVPTSPPNTLPAVTTTLGETAVASRPSPSAVEADRASVSVGNAPTPSVKRADPAGMVAQRPAGTAPIGGLNIRTLLRQAWGLGLALVWLIGLFWALGPSLIGLLRLRRLHHLCLVAEDPALLAVAAEVARGLGLRRAVTLRIGQGLVAPMTWGLWRPQILLPTEALGWPEKRRRTALLHEMAHVARWDWLTQLLAQLVCALYWFHPLAWMAARQMRLESERACDDLVLGAGVRASEYAALLLEVVRTLQTSEKYVRVAVSMAQASQIESRLRAILDGSRRRGPVRRSVSITAVCVSLSLLGGLASARVASKTPSSPTDSGLLARFPEAPMSGEVALPRVGIEVTSEEIGSRVHDPSGQAPGNRLRTQSPSPLLTSRVDTLLANPDAAHQPISPGAEQGDPLKQDTRVPADVRALDPASLQSISPPAEQDGKAELAGVRWSKAKDGLQLGIRPGSGAHVALGESLPITGYIRNVSKKEISFAFNPNASQANQRLVTMDKNGGIQAGVWSPEPWGMLRASRIPDKSAGSLEDTYPATGLTLTSYPSVLLMLLKPGETVVFWNTGVKFGAQASNPTPPGFYVGGLRPGEYRLRQGYGYRLVPLQEMRRMLAMRLPQPGMINDFISRILTSDGASHIGRALLVDAGSQDRMDYLDGAHWIAEAKFSLTPKREQSAPKATVAPVVNIENVVWGKAGDGLQAGIRYTDGKKRYEPGETVDIDVFVRNSATVPKTFSYRSSPQFDHSSPENPTIIRADGKSINLDNSGTAIEVPVKTRTLAPGEAIVVSHSRVCLDADRAMGIEPTARVEVGSYRVRQTVKVKSGLATDFNRALTSGDLTLEMVSGAAHAAWGKETNGVQAGLAFLSDRHRYAIGDMVEMNLYLRNVGKSPVQVCFAEFNRDDFMPQIVDESGAAVPVNTVYFSRWILSRTAIIKPGDTLIIGHPSVTLAAQRTPPESSVGSEALVKPGKYKIHEWATIQPYNGALPLNSGAEDQKAIQVPANVSPQSGDLEFEVTAKK